MTYWKTRGAIAFLDLILAVTAIFGALTVIPSLPREWIAGSVFTDYTIPALALGVLSAAARQWPRSQSCSGPGSGPWQQSCRL